MNIEEIVGAVLKEKMGEGPESNGGDLTEFQQVARLAEAFELVYASEDFAFNRGDLIEFKMPHQDGANRYSVRPHIFLGYLSELDARPGYHRPPIEAEDVGGTIAAHFFNCLVGVILPGSDDRFVTFLSDTMRFKPYEPKNRKDASSQ